MTCLYSEFVQVRSKLDAVLHSPPDTCALIVPAPPVSASDRQHLGQRFGSFMDLLHDQESRKSPSDNSTDSFEQLESLVLREDDLQSGSGNVPETVVTPTTAANQNLNLDLLTEETGEGLPLNMQISMTASDHSTPDAPKPSVLLDGVSQETLKLVTDVATNEPGDSDAVVPTSHSSVPPSHSDAVDEDFYQFEHRYESMQSQEAFDNQKLGEEVQSELVNRSLVEHDIYETVVIKEEPPEVSSPLSKSFIEEGSIEKAKPASAPESVPEVLQLRMTDELKKEIAEVHREVLEHAAKDREVVEEREVHSKSGSNAESPPAVSLKASPPPFQNQENQQEKEEEDHHHPVEPVLRTEPQFSHFMPTSPATNKPSLKRGPEPVSTGLEPVDTQITDTISKTKKAEMEEGAPQDCPFKSFGEYFISSFPPFIISSLHHINYTTI